MIYPTQTVILMTPEQLEQLLDDRLDKALARYVPPPPPGPDLPGLMTRKQTATTLQVSLTTLHTWSKDTEERPALLVPVSINGRIRYRREQVLVLLKEHRRFSKS